MGLKEKVIALRVPPELAEGLKVQAGREFSSISGTIRRAVAQYLRREGARSENEEKTR